MSSVNKMQIDKTVTLIIDSGIESWQYKTFLESGRFTALLRQFMEEHPDPEPNPEPIIETYTVVLDYDMPLADMIEAGDYSWVNRDIIVENFPINERESGEVELHLVHFSRYMSTREVFTELDKLRLRPAELPELLALGAAHPTLQQEYPLAALGSEWVRPSGRLYAPFLNGYDETRHLNLSWDAHDGQWDDCDRFVAVSK